jgi:hypothetical protein
MAVDLILQFYVVLDAIICILTKQLTNKQTNKLTHSLINRKQQRHS